jgi:hypothetical protein
MRSYRLVFLDRYGHLVTTLSVDCVEDRGRSLLPNRNSPSGTYHTSIMLRSGMGGVRSALVQDPNTPIVALSLLTPPPRPRSASGPGDARSAFCPPIGPATAIWPGPWRTSINEPSRGALAISRNASRVAAGLAGQDVFSTLLPGEKPRAADNRINTTLRISPEGLEALKNIAAAKRIRVNDLLLEAAEYVLGINGREMKLRVKVS